ncbi:protein TIC 20-I, chloroplastic-like isoform X2 [Gossypium arboreum]|nr:protein TIC 20-I, chloroplastic-like isoform X2 [Gossypium arboreum]
MILNGFTFPLRSVSVSSRLRKPVPCSSSFACSHHLTTTALFRSSSESGDVPFLRLSAASSPLLSGDLGGLSQALPSLPRRRGSNLVPRASKDVPYSFRFPPMTKKPKWWWRTLACLPYLMPLHETWM